MPNDDDPPFFGAGTKHSPYTVEGQIEQYGELRRARGWRRVVVQVFAIALLLVFLAGIFATLRAFG